MKNLIICKLLTARLEHFIPVMWSIDEYAGAAGHVNIGWPHLPLFAGVVTTVENREGRKQLGRLVCRQRDNHSRKLKAFLADVSPNLCAIFYFIYFVYLVVAGDPDVFP